MTHLFDLAEETLGISFSPQSRERFNKYCEVLLETNKVMNLTAITEPEQVYLKHFIDSVAVLTADDLKNKKIIDVGCGAGFPGLPIKISEPSVSLTLLDSLGKRISFLSSLIDELGLKDVRCMHARAEEEALKPEMREQFDFAVSRAVASLPMLCELCLPFVKVDGSFIAMKAQGYEEELEQAKSAIEILGAQVSKIKKYLLPGSDINHVLIIIKKVSATPANYPRRFAKIQKKPL